MTYYSSVDMGIHHCFRSSQNQRIPTLQIVNKKVYNKFSKEPKKDQNYVQELSILKKLTEVK